VLGVLAIGIGIDFANAIKYVLNLCFRRNYHPLMEKKSRFAHAVVRKNCASIQYARVPFFGQQERVYDLIMGQSEYV
jgi:hypothetical protein